MSGNERTSSDIDRAYAGTRAGDERAFTAWVRLVEMPLRARLHPFASAVDVEAILQEALIRMWRLAPGLELHGPNASLAYLLRLARNLAVSEARRLRARLHKDLENLDSDPGGSVPPAPHSDPRLGEMIRACLDRIPARPKEAIMARIRHGGIQGDRDLARGLNMRLNTFLQNIVRARKLIALCLEKSGVSWKESLS